METMKYASKSFSCSVISTLANPIHQGGGFCSPSVIRMTIRCSSTTHSAPPRFVNKGCKLVGCGSAVPKFQISNDDLAKLLDTSDEWISARTGIRNRHVITGNDSVTSLGTEAAKKALEMAKVDVDDVDLILMCSVTPDDLGGSAPQIQRALGCKNNPPAYDIRAGCSGFILGLTSAFSYIRGGAFKNVLVIGADALSRYIDWTKKEICVLLGDAAGAVLLQACDIEEDGLFGTDMHSDGNGQEYMHALVKEDATHYDEALHLKCSAVGFSPTHTVLPELYMNGKQLFRSAVTKVPQSIELALQDAGIQGSAVDWLLLHQSNQRIMDAVAKELGFPPERVISNLANHGNTSAASIPLALDEYVRSGKVKPGHIIASAGAISVCGTMETMKYASKSFSCSVISTLANPIHQGGGFCSPSVIRMTICCSSTTHSAPPRFMNKGCKLVGCGSAVPKFKISNDDLAKLVDTSDEWISVRTGISNRHVITGNDSVTSLGTEAAKKALEMAKVDVDDVDLILMCSSTPDDLCGGAPQIQRALGCKHNPPAYDIRAGCSGFILGLTSAFSQIRGGAFKNVLVIGADGLSHYIDWTKKDISVLFGDAAGAVLLQACDIEEDGLFGTDMHSDGNGYEYLHAGIKEDVTHYDEALRLKCSALGFSPKRTLLPELYMNGKQVFRFAVTKVPQSIELALQDAEIQGSAVDWLLLHQSNQRIMDVVAKELGFPPERVISNLANYGNTGAASIPLALDEYVRNGKVKPGHIIASAGYGSGFTWGSIIFKWR